MKKRITVPSAIYFVCGRAIINWRIFKSYKNPAEREGQAIQEAWEYYRKELKRWKRQAQPRPREGNG